MPTTCVPKKLCALGLLALAGGVLGLALLAGRPAEAAPSESQSVAGAAKDWGKFHYMEAKDCKLCHTAPSEDLKGSLDLCMFTEYAIWKTHDKHAQAYAAGR